MGVSLKLDVSSLHVLKISSFKTFQLARHMVIVRSRSMPACIIKVYGNSVLTLFRPMESSIKFDTVKSVDGPLYILRLQVILFK